MNNSYRKKFKLLIILLLVVVLLKGIVWSSIIPIWHFPDEQAHFAQISYMVEMGRLPQSDPQKEDLSKELYRSEELLGTLRDSSGINKYTYHPEYNLDYTNTEYGKYEKEITSIPYEDRRIMIKQEAAAYPPMYYTLSSIAYRLFYGSDLLTRIMATRWLNLLFFILMIFFVMKINLMFFKDKIIALSGTLLVAFHPMLTFVSSGINSDNLFNLIFTAVIYISLTLLYEKFSIKKIILLLILYYLAIKTKPHGILVGYIYAFPLVWQIIRGMMPKKYVAAGSLLVLLGLGYVVNQLFLGNQIIPDVSFTYFANENLTYFDHLKWSITHTYREVLPWYWGVFKWLGLVLPHPVRRIIHLILGIAVLGMVFKIFKALKKRKLEDFPQILFFIYVMIGYFAIFTVWDFLFTRTQGFSFGIQGRYFFPVIVTHMTLLIAGITAFSNKKKNKQGLAIILALLMVILNGLALYVVTGSYYSMASINTFLLQASQYKPYFSKSFFLFAYLITFSGTLMFFIYNYFLFFKRNHGKS
jgi:hypothetical protein